jgi:hypothetical protein
MFQSLWNGFIEVELIETGTLVSVNPAITGVCAGRMCSGSTDCLAKIIQNCFESKTTVVLFVAGCLMSRVQGGINLLMLWTWTIAMKAVGFVDFYALTVTDC